MRAEYYKLDTLEDIRAGKALNDFTNGLLTPAGGYWFMHRILVVDTLEYSLTGSTSFGAALVDALTAWLPTFGVSYNGQRTITLKSTQPLTIGYKLWRPAVGLQGASVGAEVGLDVLGLGDKEIRKVINEK